MSDTVLTGGKVVVTIHPVGFSTRKVAVCYGVVSKAGAIGSLVLTLTSVAVWDGDWVGLCVGGLWEMCPMPGDRSLLLIMALFTVPLRIVVNDLGGIHRPGYWTVVHHCEGCLGGGVLTTAVQFRKGALRRYRKRVWEGALVYVWAPVFEVALFLVAVLEDSVADAGSTTTAGCATTAGSAARR